LSPQCGDNLFIGKCLAKLNHPPKILFGITSAKLGRQLSRQCGDNLFTVSCTLAAQNFALDTLAYSPVEGGESYVDRRHCLTLCRCD
jgi:hypothetical protein